MHAITMVKKLTFYNRMPSGIRHGMRQALLAALLAAKGIRISVSNGSATLSKGERKVILLSDDETDVLLAVRNFDKLFCISCLEPEYGKVIDFISGVKIFGYDVTTNTASALELDTAIMAYNSHQAIKQGDIVLDCGSCHGMYALYASQKAGKSGKIFCLEPDSKNFHIIQENIRRNGISNVFPVMAGLWSKSGKLEFTDDGMGVRALPAGKCGKSLSIDVVSLEDFFKSQKLSKIDFVKMDIEGAEVEALQSSQEFIKNAKPSFAIASYHVKNGEKTAVFLEKYFDSLGYDFVTENPRHLTTYAWPKASEL